MEYNRQDLLRLASDLGIDDEEAGETDWAHYLNDQQLADAIARLRPESRVTAGSGDDRE